VPVGGLIAILAGAVVLIASFLAPTILPDEPRADPALQTETAVARALAVARTAAPLNHQVRSLEQRMARLVATLQEQENRRTEARDGLDPLGIDGLAAASDAVDFRSAAAPSESFAENGGTSVLVLYSAPHAALAANMTEALLNGGYAAAAAEVTPAPPETGFRLIAPRQSPQRRTVEQLVDAVIGAAGHAVFSEATGTAPGELELRLF